MKLEQWGCIFFIFLFIKFASFSSVSTQVLMSCLLATTFFSYFYALPAVVIQCLSSVVGAFPCHRLWFDKSFLPSATFKPFSRWAAIRNKQEGVSTSQTGGWDAPSSLGSFYWAHLGSTPIQAGRKTAYFKVPFPDFQPFLQANWWKCFPLLPSVHINIKHLQTAAACVWMQQCEMVAMSVKLQSRGQKCDCVCPDVFKPLWF